MLLYKPTKNLPPDHCLGMSSIGPEDSISQPSNVDLGTDDSIEIISITSATDNNVSLSVTPLKQLVFPLQKLKTVFHVHDKRTAEDAKKFLKVHYFVLKI